MPDMLADNAFLRRLPTILNGTQTVQLEALVFSADAIDVSFERICSLAIAHRENICSASRRVHVEMLMHAWTIVDCLHVVRQVLKVLDYRTPKAVAFAQAYEAATLLRNRMDHLTSNAGNVAKAKGRPPVYGALGYVCIPEAKLLIDGGQVSVTGGGIVSLSAGQFAGGGQVVLINPVGHELSVPVGGFRLDAFGCSLELASAHRDFRALLAEIDERLAEQCTARARALSTERGIPMEELMANPPGGLAIYAAFDLQ
ncbi:hypothetical protein RPSD_52380 (plasmid) [Ralstonia solanacearum]|nr:hypothetical protein RPSD_52380 [Ralstonia solanacearum]